IDGATRKHPGVGHERALRVAEDHPHFERIGAEKQNARRTDRRDFRRLPRAARQLAVADYFCHPTHSSPPGPRSFFQIGTVSLMRSITLRQAAKASPRCGEEHAIAIDASPTFSSPNLWTTATFTAGYSRDTAATTLAISFSAIGR